MESCNFFGSFNLRKVVRFNTRNNRCLDNIFTNLDQSLIFSDPVNLSHVSNIIGILFQCKILANRTKTRINFRPITDEELYILYQSVKLISSCGNSSDISIEYKFKMFMDIICDAMEFSFSIKTKIIENNHVQKRQSNWFDDNLKDMREKLKLFISLIKINRILMPKKSVTEYKK